MYSSILYSSSKLKLMQEVCNPLISHLGIDHICYLRIFNNCSYLLLTNDSVSFIKNFVEYSYYSKVSLDSYNKASNNNDYYFFWPEDSCDKFYSFINNKCFINNGLSIRSKRNDYVETLNFAFKYRNSFNKYNFFLNSIEKIKIFKKHFYNNLEVMIHDLERRNLATFKVKFNFNLQRNNNFTYDLFSSKNIKELPYNPKLSNREYQCVSLIRQGILENKKIAEHMNISPRTVENYVNNLKVKLRCNYKSELVEKIINTSKIIL